MTILLLKPYLVKVTTKEGGEWGKNLTTWFMGDPLAAGKSRVNAAVSHKDSAA